MNRNLRLLDRFDKERNIYELICRLAERVHSIINGSAVFVETTETDPVQIAMEELLSQSKQ